MKVRSSTCFSPTASLDLYYTFIELIDSKLVKKAMITLQVIFGIPWHSLCELLNQWWANYSSQAKSDMPNNFIRPAKSFQYFSQYREIRKERILAWRVFLYSSSVVVHHLQQTNYRYEITTCFVFQTQNILTCLLSCISTFWLCIYQ